jgi:hypothetical protein
VDFEDLPSPAMMVDVSLQELNLIIAVVTNAACIYLVVTFTFWWLRTRRLKLPLCDLIRSTAEAKTALWFWSLTGIAQILVYDMTQPLITLPSRLLWLVVVFRQISVTVRYRRGVEHALRSVHQEDE